MPGLEAPGALPRTRPALGRAPWTRVPLGSAPGLRVLSEATRYTSRFLRLTSRGHVGVHGTLIVFDEKNSVPTQPFLKHDGRRAGNPVNAPTRPSGLFFSK